MSRSRKKNPFACYVCYSSNKEDKRIANKKFRRINKIMTRCNPEKLLYRLREISNTFNFDSDGLAIYVGNSKLANSEDFKNREIYRKWLQK